MKTLRWLLDQMTPYGVWMEPTEFNNYHLVDSDGSVLETFGVIRTEGGDELDSSILDSRAAYLLSRIRIYRLVLSVVEEMQYDDSQNR
jgi:hypothetical protein